MSSNDVLDFPELSEEQPKIYFSGAYEYSQSMLYLVEIQDKNDKLTVFFPKENQSADIMILSLIHI